MFLFLNMKIIANRFYFIIVIIILCILSASLLCTCEVSAASTATPKVTPTPTSSPTGYIMGRVTLPDDATGIPDCQIELLWKGDAGLAKSSTDSMGNFYFTNVIPNDDKWSYRLIITKGNWGRSVTQEFSVLPETSTVVGIRMYPYIGKIDFTSDRPVVSADGKARINLTVTMTDVDGKPVPDDMHVQFTQSSFYSNPGKFFNGVENGTALAVPTKGGKASAQYGDIPVDTLSRSVKIEAVCVETTTGPRSISLTINLTSPNMITGTIYDLTGKPVPRARVLLERWDGVGKFQGYNSTEGGNATDGSGICDDNGTYSFTVLPAGDYRITTRESYFNNSSRVTVVRGKYTINITLPISHGSIKGWVKDINSNMVPGVNVTVYRIDEGKLLKIAERTTDYKGEFSFDDMPYGSYDVQAVIGDQTADMPFILDVPKGSVGVMLHQKVSITPVVTPNPASSTPTNTATVSIKPTPKMPTPTPWDVTPESVLGTYGLAVAAMAVACIGMLVLILKIKPK